MDPKKLINIGIMAHVDAGKTTLTEQLLYTAGAIRSAGSVDAGTTQTDWMDIERSRGISVRSSQASLDWNGRTVNILDTPGHLDFAGEVERSLSALDGAVLVVSAVEGIQSHTENLWRALSSASLPRIIFINKIDRAGSHVEKLVEEFQSSFGGKFFAADIVSGEGSRDCTVSRREDYYDALTELIADVDDDIAEKWLNEEQVLPAELDAKLAEYTRRGVITPVFFGCAQLGLGSEELLNAITDLMPTADSFNRRELSGLIFKVEHDPVMGKIAHIRMYGGELHTRDTVALQSSSCSDDERTPEKISQIRKFSGHRYVDVGNVAAGDIAALCGLSSARVGNFIGSELPCGSYSLANPFFRVKVTPKDPEKLTSMVNAIRELSDEEPLINYRWEKTSREIDINITGEIQLEVIRALLKERYDLDADFSAPTVIYRETPVKTGEGVGVYTMPKPCWAIVNFRFEPLAAGSGVVFEEERIDPDKLAYKYREHIRASFKTCLEQGIKGWEVTDFRATLTDGMHHNIHTHPLDFFVATPMAFMNTLVAADTRLLEPFIHVRIFGQEDIMGKIIGDIINMRGEFDTPVLSGGNFTIECCLPVATSVDYPVKLAALSSGRAGFYSHFDSYRPCPPGIGTETPYRGVNPLDRSKWILYKRGAYTE